MAEGIEIRHRHDCRSRDGGRCNCRPSFRASVWNPREGRKVEKTFPTKPAAKAWRHDAMVARERGELATPAKRTLREAAGAWLDGARAGMIRNRSGDEYKPAAIRGYEKDLRLRVLPRFGRVKLSELRRIDVQDFVDGMVADGLSASTIDSTLNPMRAVYRYGGCPERDNLQSDQGSRDPCRPEQAEADCRRRGSKEAPRGAERGGPGHLGDCPLRRSAPWRAARAALGARRSSRRGYPRRARLGPKGRPHRPQEPCWATPCADSGCLAGLPDRPQAPHRTLRRLVFGQDETTPFDPRRLTERADVDWEDAGLTRITLHACRHTFASYMIAAGVNAKALSTYMGHANIGITLDLYGHLMPGNESEAAELLDAYLEAQRQGADEAARAGTHGTQMGQTAVPSSGL